MMSWNGKKPRLAWLNTPSSTTRMPRAWASSISRRRAGVAAQHGVDLLVIVGVIAVIGRRLKNRREVDGVDAQVGEVIEVLDDADQVAPLIAVVGRRRAPFVQVLRLGHRQRSREPVGEDLVEDRVANPVGRLRDRPPMAARIDVRCQDSSSADGIR